MGKFLARFYVLVQTEQVHRVVLVLQGDQPLVLFGSEESLDLVLAMVGAEVKGDTGDGKGLHRPP
jgi:hypothetical protein